MEVTRSPRLVQATGDAAPAVARLVRFGFATKGIVTFLVGALALRYALGRGGEITGQEGAIRVVLDWPFGRVLLVVLGVGLAGYAVWMFVSAIIDPERKGSGFQGIAERIGFFVTGVGYALLAYGSLKLFSGKRDRGLRLDDLVAMALTPRLGRWLVGLVGVIVMVSGVLQIRQGVTAKFARQLRTGLAVAQRRLTIISGRVGYLTLGLFSLSVGSSLVEVALDYNPSEASGWDETLWLIARGGGRWVLAAASIGLIFYGAFFVLLSRNRRL